MVNFTFILTLFCTFGWICEPVCDFNTMEALPGEEVTMQCCNLSSSIGHIFWFKLANRPNISCISYMSSSESSASMKDGFDHNKFNMTSNTTTIFLNIKQVDASDSGMYFCGFDLTEKRAHRIFSATYLKVEDGFDGLPELSIGILGSIVVVLVIVIIALVVKIRIKAQRETQNQHNENLDSDAPNYAALSFCPKARSNRRPVANCELEPNVVYAATRY